VPTKARPSTTLPTKELTLPQDLPASLTKRGLFLVWIFWPSLRLWLVFWPLLLSCLENKSLEPRHWLGYHETMRCRWIACLILPALTLPALAAPETFDFKDPKDGNKIEFKLDAPLEKIAGTANAVSGTVTFDPQNPGSTRGKIVVATASMTVPNGMQTSIMRGHQWLDAGKFPEITFEVKDLSNVKTDKDKTSADVAGIFTLHGVSKEVTFPVEMKYLKDKLGEHLGGSQKGDMLVITSTNFSIKRADYNIMPGKNLDKVADTIKLTLGVAGAAPK